MGVLSSCVEWAGNPRKLWCNILSQSVTGIVCYVVVESESYIWKGLISMLAQNVMEPVPVQNTSSRDRARFFYFGAAMLLLVLMFFGFQQFYLHGKAYPERELTPPIRTLLILHGTTMTAWMVLFLVQPILIATGRRRAHMALGRFGAGLAVLIVLLGFRVAVESARVNPPDLMLWNLSPRQFLIVSVVSIVLFGVLVAVAVWNRRRPDVHRPIMLIAVLAIMPAAMDRIDAITSLYRGTLCGDLFGPFFSTLVIGFFLLILNWALTRSLDRWLAVGLAGLVLVNALTMQLATTGVWRGVADFLVR